MATSTVTTGLTRTRRRRPGWRGLLWHAWLPVALVAISLSVSERSTSFYFPPLSDILVRTWQRWIVDGGLYIDFLPSLVRLLIGFCLALLIGVAIGTLLGLIRPAEVASRPLTEAARAIPGAALLPIAMMFFSTGEAMKITMIAFISIWPIILNTIDGVRSIDPALRSAMASYQIKPLDRFFNGYLMQALPQVFAGARIGLAISVAVMVVVEMFGTPGGIGHFIRAAQQSFRVVDMWTGLIVLGIFGYVLNTLFRAIEQRVLRWHFRMVAHNQGN